MLGFGTVHINLSQLDMWSALWVFAPKLYYPLRPSLSVFLPRCVRVCASVAPLVVLLKKLAMHPIKQSATAVAGAFNSFWVTSCWLCICVHVNKVDEWKIWPLICRPFYRWKVFTAAAARWTWQIARKATLDMYGSLWKMGGSCG